MYRMKNIINIMKTIEGIRIPGIHGNPQGNPHGNPHGKPINEPKTAKKTMRIMKAPMMIPRRGVLPLIPKHTSPSYLLREGL